ncbi:MAG: hypothetical protein IJW13_03975 [Clostridia bacterium]|nr:hypothetical protein [Clostridia bacterium]
MAIINEKIKNKLKKVKIEYVIAIAAVVAIIALTFSSFNSNNQNASSATSSVEGYVNMLEEKLSTNLSKINGAGKVSVIISVQRGVTNEIATEKTIEGNVSEEVPILVSGKPIVLAEIYPEITGVVIIAKGANNLIVKASLMAAAQTFLNVSSDKIEILTMG